MRRALAVLLLVATPAFTARAQESLVVQPCAAIDTAALAAAIALELPEHAGPIVVSVHPCAATPEEVQIDFGAGDSKRILLAGPWDARFVALATAEAARQVQVAARSSAPVEPTSPPAPTDAIEPPSNGPGQSSDWSDSRPLATERERDTWYPAYRIFDTDPPRGLTSLEVGLGGSVDFGGGGAGYLSLALAHRFEAPFTVALEIDPAVLGSVRGSSFRALVARAAVGLDLPALGLDLLGGGASLADQERGPLAPSLGGRVRLGLADSWATILATDLLFPGGPPLVNLLQLRIQGQLVPGLLVFAEGRVHLRSDIWSADFGAHWWVNGRAEPGSWALCARAGILQLTGTEMGDSIVGPSLQLGLATRF